MVIGEERAVGELWERAQRRMPRPRDDRPGQPVYALREPPEPGETGLRAARLLDLDLLVPACAEAHREEIGVDPLRRDAEGFRWRTRQQIEEGRSWLWVEEGVIRFKAESSAWTPSAVQLRERVERFVREHELIPVGDNVTCLVSGGADSTCLWHLLGSLGYRVSALHVNHKLRGAESDEDARFCAETLGAEVVELDGRGLSEASLREQRRSLAPDRLRATGHTASDQVETILYRLVSRGAPTGIAPRSGDGIVHPLLPLWREETEVYC